MRRKHQSGKFSRRVDSATHEAAAIAAAAHGQSLNQWATEAIRQAALTELRIPAGNDHRS